MLLASAVATALACSSSSTSPSASIAGTYVLATVNGESLPAIVTNAGDTAVVVTDTLALSTSLTYTRHVVDTLRSQGSAPVLYSHESSGTYVHTGTSITFTDGVTHGSASGTIDNGVITIASVENGFNVTGVFDKQ
jgi:3-hydroxy-3-methylglutaryl CoA synthase